MILMIHELASVLLQCVVSTDVNWNSSAVLNVIVASKICYHILRLADPLDARQW